MAKVIQLSSDAGLTYNVLPGSSGAFNSESESADDTIFGATFKSSEVTMIAWSVSANAYYKGFAGYLAEIKQQGTTTAMTTEACTLESGKIYQINDTTKRIWDRSQTFTIFDNAVDHTADVEWVDYLFGRVKFNDSYTVTGAVTVTGNYFPTTQLGKGRTFNLTMQAEAIDNTDFATAQGNGGYRTYTPGLRTVSLELGGIFDAAVNSKADLAARNELIVEIDPAGDGSSIARGFFKIINTGQSGDVGALEEETISLELQVPVDNEIPSNVPFNWAHTGSSIIPTAIQDALQAWLDETSLEVQYLPSGAAGQTPSDAIEGTVLVTDISLAGDLNGINTFTVELQGSDAYTEI